MDRLALYFPAARQVVYLDGAGITVAGRSSTCSLPLVGLVRKEHLMLVSRRHFKITLIPSEGFIIEDLSSQNGTRVNGISLVAGAPTFLKSGDVIQLAKSSEITIEVREESGATTQALEEASVVSPLQGVLYRSLEGEFILDGQIVRHSSLSTLEYRLLDYLYDNSGRVCSYEELVVHVWGYPEDSLSQSNTISKTVSNLRRKLDEQSSGAGRRHIHTAHGRGVKLVPL